MWTHSCFPFCSCNNYCTSHSDRVNKSIRDLMQHWGRLIQYSIICNGGWGRAWGGRKSAKSSKSSKRYVTISWLYTCTFGLCVYVCMWRKCVTLQEESTWSQERVVQRGPAPHPINELGSVADGTQPQGVQPGCALSILDLKEPMCASPTTQRSKPAPVLEHDLHYSSEPLQPLGHRQTNLGVPCHALRTCEQRSCHFCQTKWSLGPGIVSLTVATLLFRARCKSSLRRRQAEMIWPEGKLLPTPCSKW